MTTALHGLDNLPYGSVVTRDGRRFAAVRFGDHALDLSQLDAGLFATGTLDALLAGGRESWTQVRSAVTAALAADLHPLVPLAEVTPVLGFAVADYVDFFASEHHATNAGRIFRPRGEPLTPNWKHLPVGYHGRAGTVVVSDTPIRRPSGQYRDGEGTVRFGASQGLDFEAEVAFVVGSGSEAGTGIRVEDFAEHVFGVCLLNDWSARDIQAWESAPLGPHLAKSFATSVSGWITPLAALDYAWVTAPTRDPIPLSYLDDAARPNGLDLSLTVILNSEEVSHPQFASMYWTPPQLLAHLTSNGAPARTGDVFASGTVSGPDREQRGCLLELTWNGSDPLHLADGRTRSYLEDGDEVTITATAPTARGRLALGEVRGRVSPAR